MSGLCPDIFSLFTGQSDPFHFSRAAIPPFPLMKKLSKSDIYSLEDYEMLRPEFRAKVLEHKRHRNIRVGENATLYFEDRMTMHYQVQEMLRAERVFTAEGIQDELDAYNPLIPDGSNLMATFMLEYVEVDERRKALAGMIGIEHRVWLKVGDHDHVWAIANDDLERSTDEKTSSVHFLRFQLTSEMVQTLRGGAPVAVGIEHQRYCHQVDPVPEAMWAALAADLD